MNIAGRLFAAALLSVAASTQAGADSCWDHNGSLMRLKASGSQRWFTYEVPRSGLAESGVRRGTLLFNGQRSGNRYYGTSRVFSRHCPDAPLEYYVEGNVSNNDTRVTLVGRREVHQQCHPTGRYTTDTLVFNYRRQC